MDIDGEDERYIQVFTTIDDREEADKIAESVVEQEVAACVQIVGPIESTYKWKGELTKSDEWLCILKSRKTSYEELEEVLLEEHPYENPEILAIPVVEGSPDYLRWIDDQMK